MADGLIQSIGPGNGLLPGGTKPLLDPIVLAKMQHVISVCIMIYAYGI